MEKPGGRMISPSRFPVEAQDTVAARSSGKPYVAGWRRNVARNVMEVAMVAPLPFALLRPFIRALRERWTSTPTLFIENDLDDRRHGDRKEQTEKTEQGAAGQKGEQDDDRGDGYCLAENDWAYSLIVGKSQHEIECHNLKEEKEIALGQGDDAGKRA
jgi:hypothetical protein